MIEGYNYLLFSILNAPAGLSDWEVTTSVFIAKVLIFAIPALLTWLWLSGEFNRRNDAISVLLASAVGLFINGLIGALWFHDRPFAMGLGNSYLQHAATSSFPSNHATLMLVASLILFSSPQSISRRMGLLLIVLTPPVAWARIYVGVHFPLDMLGAIPIAIISYAIVNNPISQIYVQRVTVMLERLQKGLVKGFCAWF